MAKTLSTVALADLLPSSIAADKTVSAAAGAIDPELRLSSANAALLPILSRIDDLPESWLDRLAWQWHADLYEQDLTIEQKRMIVKRVLLVHRFKGTPYAVKQALADMERDVTLIEYTGEHHIFELAVDLTGGEDIADLTERIFRRVNSAKPASRHLRGVRHVLSAAKTAVFGAAFSNDAKIEIWPAKPSPPKDDFVTVLRI